MKYGPMSGGGKEKGKTLMFRPFGLEYEEDYDDHDHYEEELEDNHGGEDMNLSPTSSKFP
jgi:hypothetical protein